MRKIIDHIRSKQGLHTQVQQLRTVNETLKAEIGKLDRLRQYAEGGRDFATERRDSLQLQLQNSRNQLVAERQATKAAEDRAAKAGTVVSMLNKQLTMRVNHLYRLGEMIHGGSSKQELLEQLLQWAIPVGNFSDCEDQKVEGESNG